MQIVNFVRLPNSVVVVTDDGQTHTIDRSNPVYARLVNLSLDMDVDFDVASAITKRFASGRVRIEEGVVYLDEEALHNTMTEFMLRVFEQGVDVTPFAKFAERLHDNPSFRAREQFFEFMQRNELTIDDDGFVVMYKGVREDYKDCHSGTFSNTVGSVLEMPRRNVDDDADRHCSYGYHVGAYEYVRSFGTRKMLVRVDPKDIVSVPNDSGCQKIRVCKYTVIGEVSQEDFAASEPYTQPVTDDWASEYKDEEQSYKVTVVGLTPAGELLSKDYTVHASDGAGEAKDQALDDAYYDEYFEGVEDPLRVRSVIQL